jgi:amino acid permease
LILKTVLYNVFCFVFVYYFACALNKKQRTKQTIQQKNNNKKQRTKQTIQQKNNNKKQRTKQSKIKNTKQIKAQAK